MSKLVNNDPLFVKIAPQDFFFKLPVCDGGHFEKRHFSELRTKNWETRRSSFFYYYLKYLKPLRNIGSLKVVTESRKMTPLQCLFFLKEQMSNNKKLAARVIASEGIYTCVVVIITLNLASDQVPVRVKDIYP